MGLLLLSLTIFFFAAAVLILPALAILRLRRLFLVAFGTLLGWIAFYLVLLVTVSVNSADTDLRLKESKSFCGFYLDCHMQTSIIGVRSTKAIGKFAAEGRFYIITVKVSSDAKKARLGLKNVDARIISGRGREFMRRTDAEMALGDRGKIPFDRRITPDESSEKDIVFDLPADVVAPRLLLTEGSRFERVLEGVMIGDEDSIFHGRKYFELSVSRISAGELSGRPEGDR